MVRKNYVTQFKGERKLVDLTDLVRFIFSKFYLYEKVRKGSWNCVICK